MKEGETNNDVFAFLTTAVPTRSWLQIHPKAMPVILTPQGRRSSLWLDGPDRKEALKALQRPLPDDAI